MVMIDDSALIHGKAYDPVKAREYYLRTRKLKGRGAGAGLITGPRRAGTTGGAPIDRQSITKVPVRKKSNRRREEAKARAEALELRLERLKLVLADLVKQAKARSGVEAKPDKKNSAPAKKAAAKDKAPKSAAEKNDAAKRAKEYYEKNKAPTQEVKTLEADVKIMEQKIQKARRELKASVAKARKKADAKPSKSKPKTEANKGRRH